MMKEKSDIILCWLLFFWALKPGGGRSPNTLRINTQPIHKISNVLLGFVLISS